MDALANGTVSEARRVIEDVVTRHFSPGLVAWVEVAPCNYDGDDDLRVDVVLTRPFSAAVGAQMDGLTGLLRGRLAEMGDRRFPVVHVMTEKEAKKLKRDAARFT